MTLRGIRQVGPALDGMARLAMAALGAEGVLVVDERSGAPCVVATCGDAPPPQVVAFSGSAQLVHRSRCSEGQVLSAALLNMCAHPVGGLHVRCPDDGPVGRDPLLRAFARHIGLALTHRDASRPDDHCLHTVLPWEDLSHLSAAIDEITARVTDIMRPLIGVTAVGITVWDADRGILRALPGSFGVDDDRLTASVTGPATNMLSAGTRVFASGLPYLSNDAGADPGVLQPYVEVFRIHRILSVPLAGHGHRVGVLHLVNKPTEFTPDDVAVVEGLAPQLTTAVELARSVGRMAAQQRLEGILTRTAVAIAAGAQAEDCLLPAFDELAAVTNASVVALVPRESAPLLRRKGQPNADLERQLICAARELTHTSSGAFPHRAGDPGWAALHAPVELHGERAATLSVLRRTGQPINEQEGDVVTRLASLVALAWTSERYQHQLAEIARLRERERIADELHDRVAQIFYAAQLGLDSALENTSDPDDARSIAEVRDLLVHGDTAVREVIHRLGPVPEPSLARRLRREIEAVEEEFGVAVRVEIGEDDSLLAAPRSIADVAVKIAREGMVNAAKHAGPCRIRLEAGTDTGALVVAVHDDGFGLREKPADAQGMGLSSLHRAAEAAGGSVRVTTSTNGFGTRLTATFPI